MFVKAIRCSGEVVCEKPIYPSDVDFVTYSLDNISLEAGSIQVGIEIDAPPIFARIKNLRLILCDQ